MNNIEDWLERIEAKVNVLVERQQIRDWYDVAEFAAAVGKAEFTVREWARFGRIRGEKRQSGRGKYLGWRFAHSELERYRKDGLLPLRVRLEGEINE